MIKTRKLSSKKHQDRSGYKCLAIGPGGRNCSCCFPAPGSKARRWKYRLAKKEDNKNAFRLEVVGNDLSF